MIWASMIGWRGDCSKPMLMMLASRLGRRGYTYCILAMMQTTVELSGVETPRTMLVESLVDPRDGQDYRCA